VRYLGVDLGDKRTGLAVGDDQTGLVSPAETLEVSIVVEDGAALLRAIAAAADRLMGAAPAGRTGRVFGCDELAAHASGAGQHGEGGGGGWGKGAPEVGSLVVGLPLNMDDSEGPRAKLVRVFAERLAAVSGRDVHVFDERLTSHAADAAMARSGLTHKQKKARRDALAAAAILTDFLTERRRRQNEAGSADGFRDGGSDGEHRMTGPDSSRTEGDSADED